MQPLRLPVTAFVVLSSMMGLRHAYGETGDATWFMKEYSIAAPMLEEKLSTGVYLEEQYSGDGEIIAQIETSIRDGLLRTVATPPSGTDAVRLLREGKILILREEPEGEYSIASVQEGERDDLLDTMRTKSTFPFAAYCIFEKRIRDFIMDPGFVVIGTEWIHSEDGPQMFRIDWESAYRHPSSGEMQTRVGWFIFVPEHLWILKGYGFAYSKEATGRKHGVLEYQWTGGQPALQSFRSFTKNGEMTVELGRVSLKEHSSLALPENEFRLSAYGLPDTLVRENKSDRGVATGAFVLYGSIVLWCAAMLVYVIWQWKSRSEKGERKIKP